MKMKEVSEQNLNGEFKGILQQQTRLLIDFYPIEAIYVPKIRWFMLIIEIEPIISIHVRGTPKRKHWGS